MTEFDACYFCGAAVDAPIAEYDVVPGTVSDDAGPTASLCTACKGKLEKVLEPTLGRLDGTTGTGTVRLDPVHGESPPARGVDGRSGERTDDESTTRPSGSTDPGKSTQETSATFEGGIELEPAAADGESPAAEQSADDADTAGNGERTQATAEDTSRDAQISDSAPERPETETYNRVIRLLQNREFPIDRSEFETLASSAYEVTPAECEQVLEYAIYRGELDERDGMLRKPEDS